ncbi:hypothetical protein FH972_024390 [Carpinus fangiana]|uniref:Uncharacterized protein n=1 Tax=Carpinus fangiana TaxID=176857 RepID=A0A5N6KYE1_9ROSI|nr:hypothetical protein FH972_024390 [Carpinus fangiana]
MADSSPSQSLASHPLVLLKPPNLTPIDYLLVIQKELDPDSPVLQSNLAVLNHLLQHDKDLVEQIGWDLVTVLSPLLPASTHLLDLIFARGNAKEVVMRTSMLFQLLFRDDLEDHDSNSVDSDEAVKPFPLTRNMPHQVIQYAFLARALPVVLARLKVKRPSRFAAPLLKAMLGAFERATQFHSYSETQHMLDATLTFLRGISTDGKPSLPSRDPSSQSDKSAFELLKLRLQLPPRPSAESISKLKPTDELAIHTRLVQAFIVSIYEIYALAPASSDSSAPEFGFGWAGRIQELYDPRTLLPGLPSGIAQHKGQRLNARFMNNAQLTEQDENIDILLALAEDHGITSAALLRDATSSHIKDLSATEGQIDEAGSLGKKNAWDFESDDPPNTTDDITFSSQAAAMILAAKTFNLAFSASSCARDDDSMALLFLNKSKVRLGLVERLISHEVELRIFPEHAAIVEACMDDSQTLPSDEVIDAILALGLNATNSDKMGIQGHPEALYAYLLKITRISACSGSPRLRYLAHKLASTVLHSHPEPKNRLSFIIDTLAECPFDNLRESAVAWLKTETLSATGDTPFANGEALREAAKHLFPDLRHEWDGERAGVKLNAIIDNNGFTLAMLNFYHLLILAQRLHEPLGIADLHHKVVSPLYLSPLKTVLDEVRSGLVTHEDKLSAQSNHDRSADVANAQEIRVQIDLLASLVATIEDEADHL